MNNKIYQIQIALRGFSPKIWRSVLVSSDVLLSEFHYIIQIAMGWEDAHLHQFVKDKTFYVPEKMSDDFFGGAMNDVDYQNIKISDLLKRARSKMVYEYDFGDSWEHDIIVEKTLPADKNMKYPVCIAGEMNCPPEDCGGVWGYVDMLEILQQPDHEEYEDYLDWLGDEFDPEYFNIDEVNKLLKRLR